MELLHAPAALHEFDREPIEQLGVRRLFAHLAEVVDRRDDPPAEMVMPGAIDDHSRGQGILLRRDPLG
jgi:hypothetical protein